jgi:thymidylate synthase (FAD)
MEDDPELQQILAAAADASHTAYAELLAKLEERFSDGEPTESLGVLRRKQARQAARSVLPNATETRVVVTGNYRAWRHFIAMRASEHADVEIRRLAIACLRRLAGVAPAVFGDFQIISLADGTEVATSPLATEA